MEVALKDLKRVVKMYGPRETARHIKRALRAKKLKPADLSIRDLSEALITTRDGEPVGRSWWRRLGPQKSGGATLLESSAGVMTSNFNDVNGQIIYNRVLDAYKQATRVGDRLVTTQPTDLNGEKIAGIGNVPENVDDIHESMPYPEYGLQPDWVKTPETKKKGLIISVTKEAIFFDRTKQILMRAGSVGEILGRRKEKDILKVVLGLVNNYNWKDTAYNTYLTSGNWVNSQTGVTLSDWTQLDGAEQLFANMLDPNSGEPIDIDPKQILHMPGLRHRFRQIVRATTLETLTSTGNERRFGPNTIDPYELIESKYAYRELIKSGVSAADATATWLIGEFQKAFIYMENWPIGVSQAPQNSEAEFKQDIAYRFKASERGVAAVWNPRYVVKVKNN